MNNIFRNTFKHLGTLGQVQVKQMFGASAFYVDGVLLMLHKNRRLYLRGTDSQTTYFSQKGYTRFQANMLGLNHKADYFELPPHPWSLFSLTLCEAEVSLDHLKKSRSTYSTLPTQLKELPNLKYSTEKLLNLAGVNSIDKLKEIGSIGAVEAIKLNTRHKPTIELIWSLEGAIRGVHRSQLPSTLKSALLLEAQKLS